MVRKASTDASKPLVIVESPAKARTISKFLGKDYTIEASIGHIRDLPQGAKELPEKYKKEAWAHLGVNVDSEFEPVYVIPHEKAKQVAKLRKLLEDASELYLATDEDREGEAISWHLCEVLRPKVPVRRLVFHEITKEAIQEALKQPRDVDTNLVRAQEARRIIDRLYGYEVSPLLWRKVRPKLSAGRVQSVAVRLIADRERQRMAFVAATYWDILGMFAKQGGSSFQAGLVSVGGRRIPTSRDFDSSTGRLKDPSLLLLDQGQVEELVGRLRRETPRVNRVESKPYTTKPSPPFTTSTLQQEANRKHGFTARRTMQAAQSLYENGHITYMRTDSTSLAQMAVEAARELVRSLYGPEYLPREARVYRTKVKNAQEAHEAIRPAGARFERPEELRDQLSADEFKLYTLIWKRTVACQMADARGHRTTIDVGLDNAIFQVNGKTIEFPGYLRAYVEGSDDPNAELADRETVLPQVTVGESLACDKLESKSHTTQPPNRYSEASLTQALEEMGIGRPSTYASIIETILARKYVFKKSNSLVPTWVAFAVSNLLENHLPDLVDYQFTAEMEDELDAISRGELGHVDYLRLFYFGNAHPGLKQQLANKVGEIDARDVSRIPIGTPAERSENAGEPVFVRVGRYGPFLEQGERRASLPEEMPPDELTLAAALEMLDKATQGDEPLGMCPETGKPIFLKTGRFGPYVQRGSADDEEKPQNASLMKGMSPEDVNLEMALKLLSLPRDLGEHAESKESIVVHNGRYGPYVKCGSETRSLPAAISPLDVTLEQAIELLAQPKTRRGATAKKEPLKVFDASPVTQQPVELLEGRYGPYVTDGVTNASLPRAQSPDELSFEQALDLLAERAAKGPSSKKKAAAKKTTAKKTPKKTTKKKTGGTRTSKATAKKSASKKPKKSDE
ncbi:MAG TPA: type I DNA topoisomerase [Planctomycetaceae bacterium]|nr:type I DNA topoisomerase [Planctomycetaceae bacterium]